MLVTVKARGFVWFIVRMQDHPSISREGYSPAEFARSFGKHASWAYRNLYAGRLKAVTQFGRLLIPRSEMERLTATAETYNPKPKKPKAHAAEPKEAG